MRQEEWDGDVGMEIGGSEVEDEGDSEGSEGQEATMYEEDSDQMEDSSVQDHAAVNETL